MADFTCRDGCRGSRAGSFRHGGGHIRCYKAGCYRIGGDEFVVSLNGSRETLLACADRIREEVAVADAGSEFPVSAALGLAWSEDQPDPIPAQVFRQADDAMYADKKRMKASRKA